MTPQEIFNALIQGTKVKLTNNKFEELQQEFEKYGNDPQTNIFQVYQIEQSVCNLYNEEDTTVYYEFSFDDIILFI
jgi:hypothetical protein